MTTFLRKLSHGNGGWWAVAVCAGMLTAPVRAADPAPDAAKNPTAPTAAPAPMKGLLDRGHLLGPGDTVDIVVDGYAQFSRTVKLFADGSFDYPVLETVQARGITTAELRDRIVEGFRKELRRPVVYVSLVDIYIPPPPLPKAIPKFWAYGPISRKGEIQIPEPKPFRQILQELGPSDAADLTNIRVKYPDPKVPAKYIDASSFSKEGVIRDDILIKGGEEIILVEKPTPPRPELVRVQVLGFVNKAGTSLSLEGRVPILEVIEKAGGPKPGAAMDRVTVRNGDSERIVNVEKYRDGDVDANYFLKDGDVVHVLSKPLKVLVFGEVQKAGEIAVDDDQTLAGLLTLVAINPAANRTSIELIRERDGKVTRKMINVESILRQKKEDVPLVQGDVLWVPPKKASKGGVLGYLAGIASPLWLLRTMTTGVF